MQLLFVFIIFILMFMQLSCIRKCNTVTGPNDISYILLSKPSCYEDYEDKNILINSPEDYKILCPDKEPPASWDFTNKTYIVITVSNTAKEPYLAGVGNDQSNQNQILVTIGLPCNYGAVPLIIVYKTFVIEIAKTSKTLKVDIKKESY